MFTRARIKLTAWYLLIIMFVSVSFSWVIYQAITHEVERFAETQKLRIERRLRESVHPQGEFSQPIAPSQIPVMDPELVEETKSRFLMTLIIINGSIFLFSGGLGYILAGRTLKPIQDMLDEQNQFISDASHELRTPLTSIRSAIEVNLRDKNMTLSDAKTLLTENMEEVQKLQNLSDALLTLAQYKISNGNVQMHKLALHEVLVKALKRVEPMAKKKNITLQKSIEETEIKGNPDSLCDMFVILLDNAIKYSFSDMKVTVSQKNTNGNVTIIVKDTGIGIGPKDLPHIFDRFYRADSARSKSGEGGYGLGLSIAKNIVKMHSGVMDVKSKEKKGSTFTVTFPKTV